MTNADLMRLDQVTVEGLFGVYHHNIDLKLNDRITLLHGPNGVGKTSVLRMTDALLRGNFSYFRTIPIDRIALRFHRGMTLDLTRCRKPLKSGATHKLKLLRGTSPESAELNLSPISANTIAERIEYLRPLGRGTNTWIDLRDDEVLNESEVISRYGNASSGADAHAEYRFPWFHEFSHRAKTHLIEAQRLIKTEQPTHRRYYPDYSPTTTSSVFDCGRDFQKRLGDTMAAYGRQAQSLDQSFPQRLISATEILESDALQENMSILDQKTADLKKIGILDETPVHPFDVSSLSQTDDSTQVRVMTLYVRDTEAKLGVLDDLASRTRLFLNNVNKKFRHKKILLDREEGLVAIGDSDQRLPLDSLSSGEQHELVLHYDLLFRIPRNTLVLIDEPELSLHVAWQKQFLPDLLGVVDLTSFDVLVATHSPFIVGDREDLMVALSDPE